LYRELPEEQVATTPRIELVSSIAGEMQTPLDDKKLFNKQ
jgi:hypothetical protein